MAKVPVMGRVKTRLAAEIGNLQAVRFYRHTLASVVSRLGRDPRWRTFLSIAPDAGIAARVWPRGIGKHAQGSGDLGRRMQRIMRVAPPGPVIIVGTDIPAIRPAHIAHAFRLLSRGAAVIGPTPDGGYWLVGLRRSPRTLEPFENVRWSSPQTLDDTVANLATQFVDYAVTLADVDNGGDLAHCRSWFGRRVLPVG